MLAVDVEGPVTPVAADPPFVILAPAAIPSLDCVSLAKAASAAPSRAARVPRAVAASGLFDVLLEDARLLLAIVICVREPSQTLPRGTRRPRVQRQKDTACAQSTSNVPSPRSRAMRPG